MNILQLSKHMSDSGVNSHIIELSRQLQYLGNKVIVASSGGPHVDKLTNNDIVHVEIDFKTNNPIIQLNNIFKLIKIVSENNIEVIHSHWRKTSIIAQLIKMLTGINFVWTNHLNSIPSDLIHRKLTFYGKKAITVSSDMVPFLNSKLNINKNDIAVVYNALEKEKYKLPEIEAKKIIRNKLGINESDIVITLLGRLDPVKGHLFLIEAMNKIVLHHPNRKFKLVFTGRGSDEYKNEIQQLAKKYKLNNNIIYTGYTDPVEVLSISDLMVLPSKNEGFPISCVEAFAMRVPVIRTKTGGYSDMKNYCIGIEYGNVEGLSQAIEDVISNEGLKTNMINTAYSFFNEQLTSDKMAKKILKIYGE